MTERPPRRPAPFGSTSELALIAIVAEGEDWLVVDKPPHVEAHPSRPNSRRTLWDGLRELLAYELLNGGQISLINRLDRETSGLMLVAKQAAAARRLHLEMQAQRIGKEYLALVWGWPRENAFTVDAPLLRQGSRGPAQIYLKRSVHPEGARARTRFQVEQLWRGLNGGRFATIRAFPETGRTHQIRVHLSHHGCPVVGDKIYGPDEACYLEFIATGWTPALEARLLLPRQALHSAALHLPELGLSWRSTWPTDVAQWMRENLQPGPEQS